MEVCAHTERENAQSTMMGRLALVPRKLDRTREQGAWDSVGMIIDKGIVAALNI